MPASQQALPVGPGRRSPVVYQALAVLAAGAFFYLLFLRPPAGLRIHSVQGATMGTTWHAQLVTADPQAAQEAGAALSDLLQHLDREVFSSWSENSELMRLNAGPPGRPLPASPAMLTVLQLAQDLHARSHGAFDISAGPLVNLWGFGPQPAQGMPDAAAIAAAKARLGLGAMQIDAAAGTVTFARKLTLDVAGLAEGYAVDAMADLLRQLGFAAFVAEIGGEIRVHGTRPDATGWVLAIERPEEGPRAAFVTLATDGAPLALSVSGAYRNYRELDGRRFMHAIDPRTGMPAAHALASVAVISDTAALADAWSTALLVLGPDEGRAVADVEGLAAYFIMRAPTGFEHTYTAAFARYLKAEPAGD